MLRTFWQDYTGIYDRESESFALFGKGTVPKRHVSERTPCLGFEPETLVERHLTTANRRKLCDSRAIWTAHEKTPGTLALGVLRQPVGSDFPLPNKRLPFPNSLRNMSRASQIPNR